MKELRQTIDFSDLAAKRQFMSGVQRLTGLYDVVVKQRKLTRSLNANRYYFSAVVGPWQAYLEDVTGESVTTEEAHEILKERILGMREVVDKKTGDVIRLPHRTRDMNVDQFTMYVDECIRFLAEFAGIVVLDPSLFVEDKTKKRKEAA